MSPLGSWRSVAVASRRASWCSLSPVGSPWVLSFSVSTSAAGSEVGVSAVLFAYVQAFCLFPACHPRLCNTAMRPLPRRQAVVRRVQRSRWKRSLQVSCYRSVIALISCALWGCPGAALHLDCHRDISNCLLCSSFGCTHVSAGALFSTQSPLRAWRRPSSTRVPLRA